MRNKVLLLLLAACCAGCQGADEPAGPRHIFLITVDTLRADHLGTYGYARDTSPNLDRLANSGVLFETAVAQWPKTGPSFASLFTGQYPLTTGLTHRAAVQLPREYLTLPEFLEMQGFTTLAVVSNAVLSSELGWDQGFDEYLEISRLTGTLVDDPEIYRSGMNALRVNEFALPLLERHRTADRLFIWVHYSDPHTPYLLPDGVDNPFLGDAFYRGEEKAKIPRPRAIAIGQHRDLKFYVAQYDANIRFVDHQVQELLSRADGLGLLDDAQVIFTADHGESLGEHNYFFEHGRLPYNNTARVPLFFYRTDGLDGGRRVDRCVELLDLYPTLRDLVAPGQEVAGLEGQSLTPFLRAGQSRPEETAAFEFAFSQAGGGGGASRSHFRSVQDGEWKLVFHPARRARPASWELYDLRQNPGETLDVANLHPGQVRRLAREMSAWMKGRDWIDPPDGLVRERSEDTLRALRALGYVQ